MIEIKNVSKTYPGGIKANDNISFTVNNGETVALVGPNGSGKTTLIRQILGVISPPERGGFSSTADMTLPITQHTFPRCRLSILPSL